MVFHYWNSSLTILLRIQNIIVFDTILFYISDLDSLSDFQIFCKNDTDSPEYWEYTGYAMLEAYMSNFGFIAEYKEAIVEKLSLSADEWLELNIKDYPIYGTENPIFNDEFYIFLAEKIAVGFQKCFDKKNYPWKNCFLDFFPDSDFHNGEVFDLKNNQWIKLERNYY